MKTLPWRAVLLALSVVPWWSRPAQAYCRMTTAEPPSDPFQCTSDGIPLAWGARALHYVLQKDLYRGMDETALRAEIATSFDTWSAIRCPGGAHGVTIDMDPGTSDESRPAHSLEEENVNVIVFHTGGEWRRFGLDPQAFALTEVWFNANNGEILGADMEINGGRGPYVVCPDQGCTPGSGSDLRNVITHEAGHFLGLAHSDVADATMYFSAKEWETNKRTLSQDDVDGFCDAYLYSSSGCGACVATGRRPRLGPWLFATCLVWVLWRRRGRRERRAA